VKKVLEITKTRKKGKLFSNFFPQVRDPEKSFEKRRMDVLSFVRVKENVRVAYYQKYYVRLVSCTCFALPCSKFGVDEVFEHYLTELSSKRSMEFWSGSRFSFRVDFQFSTYFCLRLRFFVITMK